MTLKQLVEVLSGGKDASALPDSPGLFRRAEHLPQQCSQWIPMREVSIKHYPKVLRTRINMRVNTFYLEFRE